jgi:S1-C subfamily serine protease
MPSNERPPLSARKWGMVSVGCCAAALVTLLAILSPTAAAQQAEDFQKLLAEKAPAIVTVKFVLKMKGRWGETEDEREVSAAMIEPDGLVLCSNSMLGGFGRWGRTEGTTITPTDIKVLIGDDTEGRDAKLIARDSELDLTWIRIEDPGDGGFAFVDLSASNTPSIGEELYSIMRLGKYFDRVPVVREGRLGGITRKPRALYIPTSGGASVGLPVFNSKGAVVGVAIMQQPDPEETEGGGAGWYGPSRVILPAADAFKATKRAKEVAAADEGEEEPEESEPASDKDED